MKKFFESGYAFFLVAFMFLMLTLLSEKGAAYLSVGVVFFILGLAVRKKNAKKATEQTPKT
ncbi:MAG: hypothetical protein HZB59_08280 [Ignavibacteriales bacterium]|nr:hypothetical protein [Ignavibacteriales bacterium]